MGQGYISISAREYKQLFAEIIQLCITALNDQEVRKKKTSQKYKNSTIECWNNSKLGIYFPGNWGSMLHIRSWI